jgi:hypothetical protein
MSIKPTSRIAVVAALSTGAAAAFAGDLPVLARQPTGFISPLTLRFVQPEDDPHQPALCQTLRCPPTLVYGGQSGGLPTIDPAFKADLPNVRVSIVIQEVSHLPVADGFVSDEVNLITWETHSDAASVQKGGPFHIVPPGSGQTWNVSFLVYDALVYGACDTFSSFPITHTATVSAGGTAAGVFEGTDNTTLDSTGFYNVSYFVVADHGGMSHFTFSGKVTVTCSGAYAL